MAFYAARQPILNEAKDLVGYELLFRASLDNIFPSVDQEHATSKMMEGLYLDMGLDKIAEDKTAFINFTKKSLINRLPALLPKEKVTIEILESVQPTKKVYECMKELHDIGYTIALDDFIHSHQWEPFYPLCKVIKVDCLDITDEQLQDIVAITKRYSHIKLLAEKVEDSKMFEKYKALGFTLFQGYFFAKPEVIKSVSLSSPQSVVSVLLSEISKPEPDLKAIVKTFEMDARLSFRLLRYVQSPIFQRRKKIEDIKQAIVMLGRNELKRFVMLLFAATFNEDKPSELIKLSLQRAKLCESLAANKNKDSGSSAFLIGMLSLLDAMLDADIEHIISELPLSDDIIKALIEREGRLSHYLEICEATERADWSKIKNEGDAIATSVDNIAKLHMEACEWADERMVALEELRAYK